MKTHINFFVSLVASLLLLGGNAAYANVAGYVQFVNGVVQLTDPAGQTRSVQKGDAVNEGDTLTSARNASAQIKMQEAQLASTDAQRQAQIASTEQLTANRQREDALSRGSMYDIGDVINPEDASIIGKSVPGMLDDQQSLPARTLSKHSFDRRLHLRAESVSSRLE